jgi:hypothetical protein
VILRVRDVRLRVDRPNTTINPTSCAPKSVNGQITGVGGSIFTTADDSVFNAQTPFQVAICGSLPFKPKLSLHLFGGTHRGSHPKLKAIASFPAGGANTAFASVALPHSEFLDQGHIGTVCTSDANLVGRIDSVNGGIRNTFEFVPDVPVTSASFNFFGGSKGLLVNSRDICKAPARATAKFTGQNGDQLTLHPVLKSACGKAKKHKRHKHSPRSPSRR